MSVTIKNADGDIILAGFVNKKWLQHYQDLGYTIENGEQRKSQKTTISKESTRSLLFKLIMQSSQNGLCLPLHRDSNITHSSAMALIDIYAGMARAQLKKVGYNKGDEHAINRRQVEQWRAAGSPNNDIPSCLDGAWVSDIELEAQAIEQKAKQYDDAVMTIRHIQKNAEAQIKSATAEQLPALLDNVKSSLGVSI